MSEETPEVTPEEAGAKAPLDAVWEMMVEKLDTAVIVMTVDSDGGMFLFGASHVTKEMVLDALKQSAMQIEGRGN